MCLYLSWQPGSMRQSELCPSVTSYVRTGVSGEYASSTAAVGRMRKALGVPSEREAMVVYGPRSGISTQHECMLAVRAERTAQLICMEAHTDVSYFFSTS